MQKMHRSVEDAETDYQVTYLGCWTADFVRGSNLTERNIEVVDMLVLLIRLK